MLKKIQDEVGAWSDRNFGVVQFHNHPRPVLNLISATGTLAHAILKASQNLRGISQDTLVGFLEGRVPMFHGLADDVRACHAGFWTTREGRVMGRTADGTTTIIHGWRVAPLLGLAEEIGEIASAITSEESITDHARELVEDGIGDVMIFLLNFCHSNGLDAEAILTKTWAEVGKRDWVQFPGNGVDK